MLLHVEHESTKFKWRLGMSGTSLENAGATSIRAALWLQPGQAQDTHDCARLTTFFDSFVPACREPNVRTQDKPEAFVVSMNHAKCSVALQACAQHAVLKMNRSDIS